VLFQQVFDNTVDRFMIVARSAHGLGWINHDYLSAVTADEFNLIHQTNSPKYCFEFLFNWRDPSRCCLFLFRLLFQQRRCNRKRHFKGPLVKHPADDLHLLMQLAELVGRQVGVRNLQQFVGCAVERLDDSQQRREVRL
jgi:hypothetical protein